MGRWERWDKISKNLTRGNLAKYLRGARCKKILFNKGCFFYSLKNINVTSNLDNTGTLAQPSLRIVPLHAVQSDLSDSEPLFFSNFWLCRKML